MAFMSVGESNTELDEEPSGRLGKIVSIGKDASDLYFRPKKFESRELYSSMGAEVIKKYMPTGDLLTKKLLKGRGIISVRASLQSVRFYEGMTRAYESVHLAGFAWMLESFVKSAMMHDVKGAAYSVSVNAVINVAPIILQRYNRIRLLDVIDRMETREVSKQCEDDIDIRWDNVGSEASLPSSKGNFRV